VKEFRKFVKVINKTACF